MSLQITPSILSSDFAHHFVVGGSSSTPYVYEGGAAAPNAHDTFTDTQPAAIQNPQVASAKSAEIEYVGGSETVATDEAPVLHANLLADIAPGIGIVLGTVAGISLGYLSYNVRKYFSPDRFEDKDVEIRNLPKSCKGYDFEWSRMNLLTALEIKRRGGTIDLSGLGERIEFNAPSRNQINENGLQGVRLSTADFGNLRQHGVTNFNGADLRGVDFQWKDLRGIRWGTAQVNPTVINNMEGLEGAYLDSCAFTFFSDANVLNFSKATIHQIVASSLRNQFYNFTKTKFIRADLTGIDWNWQSLGFPGKYAIVLLFKSKLDRAAFRYMYSNGQRNFSHADFSHADLSGLILSGCNLSVADLRRANLTGITWDDVKIDASAINEGKLLAFATLDDAAKAFFTSQGVKID